MDNIKILTLVIGNTDLFQPYSLQEISFFQSDFFYEKIDIFNIFAQTIIDSKEQNQDANIWSSEFSLEMIINTPDLNTIFIDDILPLLLEYYYTNDTVLGFLKIENNSKFPSGRKMPQTDWGILEKVVNKGYMISE
jgi:hypothetical protein